MKARKYAVIGLPMAILLLAGAGYFAWRSTRHHGWETIPAEPGHVFAAGTGGGSVPAAQWLQAPDGGMGQYGYAMQQSASPSQTLQALSEWNSYVTFRAGWGMTTALVERLATADWNARVAGSPTITPEQLAAAATNLINNKLSTMTAQQQEDLFQQNMVEVTPKTTWGLNSYFPHATASQNTDGTWRVTISPTAFSKRKAIYQTLAPGMVSSSTNLYPGEAMLVAYSVASADMGFGEDVESKVKKKIGDMTGLDMTNRNLYGEQGYVRRRPLNTFLTEPAMSQFYYDLGF